jgi:UDP-N-acetylglucosamine--N-acetylmuramyl-(pentapeptide) pyrophosphoryl-undecaprenol N-acetylglucosamine transferase
MDERTSHVPGGRARRVLLAGGGSGGHVFPALAVGQSLAARGWSVSFAGTAQGMEARLVPAAGVDFHALAASPIVGRGLVGRMFGGATMVRSAMSARNLVRRLDAKVVVGTGGYVSAPAVLGARLARRPVVLVEPNAHAGAANRFLSRFARYAALGTEEAAGDLRCETQLTGVPVRREFARQPSPLPAEPRVLVLGGSQGARRLNELLPAALARLARAVPGLTVFHQAGERWLGEARAAYERAEVDARVVPFLDDIAGAMAAARLIVSRAGANTLAEIACAGRPAVLLPLAAAAGHQGDNARAFAAAGAGLVFDDASGIEGLTELLERAFGAGVAERHAASAAAMARPGAADAIADLVELVAAEAADAKDRRDTPSSARERAS